MPSSPFVTPRVSVLVAVYRPTREILCETIGSVLDQTFEDFELLLLDDCPDDSCEAVVREFDDPRIAYAKNERNLGITPTRNRLMEWARGEYLAVLDHDDVCRADRLEKEVAYLDAHRDCVAVSSFVRTIPDGEILRRPVENEEIRIQMMGGCVMFHSASLLRASVLKEHRIVYEEMFSPSEDYRLFLRLMEFGHLHTIPELLIDYRIHEGNTTIAQFGRMWDTAERAHTEAKERFPELWAEFRRRGGKAPTRRKGLFKRIGGWFRL